MTKIIEIEKSESNFNHLLKLKEINIDIITLTKHNISKEMAIGNTDKLNITLKDIIGIETYKATPDVIMELAGKTGEVLIGFRLEKIGKTGVRITKIRWL